MDDRYIAQLLRQIFTEQEILILQLKMYNAVSCQAGNEYVINNIILAKLGGEPLVVEKENIYD